MSTLFNITHEAGDLSEYDSTVIDGGDLSAHADAALARTSVGLRCTVNDTTAIYGLKNQTAPGSNQIRLRYHLDPNTLTMANAEAVYNLIATSTVAPNWLLVTLLYYSGGTYYLYAYALDDEGAWDKFLGPFALSDAPHYVELYLIRESSDGADDGTLQLWLDGALQGTLTTVDNWAVFAGLNAITFGAIAFTGTPTGTLYLDELRANDDGKRIGPRGLAARINHHYRTRRA